MKSNLKIGATLTFTKPPYNDSTSLFNMENVGENWGNYVGNLSKTENTQILEAKGTGALNYTEITIWALDFTFSRIQSILQMKFTEQRFPNLVSSTCE